MGPADAAGEEASVSGSGLRPLAGRVRRGDGAPGQGGKQGCRLELQAGETTPKSDVSVF